MYLSSALQCLSTGLGVEASPDGHILEAGFVTEDDIHAHDGVVRSGRLTAGEEFLELQR